MKKLFLVGTALFIAIAMAAVAMAANEYTSSASFSPRAKGTPKKPVPVAINIGFDVTETEGKRPKSMSALRIKLGGVVTNGRRFKKCTATAMERAQSDDNCPRGSRIAGGYALNTAGNRSNFDDRSIRSYLTIRLYNAGGNKMALWVEGDPNASDPTKQCPLDPATAIPVNISRSSGNSTMRLSIPENLKHPVSTLTNSIVEMRLKGARKTRRFRGRRIGMFEVVGKCRRRAGRLTRNVTYTWTNEDGSQPKQTARARC